MNFIRNSRLIEINCTTHLKKTLPCISPHKKQEQSIVSISIKINFCKKYKKGVFLEHALFYRKYN